jgi:hypothetical protein
MDHFRTQSEHFSEPVIIENPAARLDLLPENHFDDLEMLSPPDGRHWRIIEHDTLAEIEIVQDFVPPFVDTIDLSEPVIITFNVVNLHGNPNPQSAGVMKILWNDPDLEFHCVPASGPAAGLLRWRKAGGPGTNRRVGLVAEDNPIPFDYRIYSVSYKNAAGPVTHQRNSQSQSITVTLSAP